MKRITTKKRIFIGVGMISFLLMLTPSIPAYEFHHIIETHTISFQNNPEITIDQTQYLYDQLQKKGINTNVLTKQKSDIVKSCNYLLDILSHKSGSDALPSFLVGLIHLLISLLLALIGTINGIIFGPLIALIVKIVTAPAIILAKIIGFIVNLLSKIQIKNIPCDN